MRSPRTIACALWILLLPVGSEARREGATEARRSSLHQAIGRGLKFLEATQRSDGSWGTQNRVAKTSLACLAFMASDSLPGRGPYAKRLQSGLDFILRCSRRRQGHITDWQTNDWSDTHNHGYGLLFLALAYGSIQNEDLAEDVRVAIHRGIALSLKAQTPGGGWGYSITAPNHNGMKDEGSCTITQITALRACREAGFAVPRQPIEKAVAYIKACAYRGGFYYALDHQGKPLVRLGDGTFVPGSSPRFAITAAAVSVLNAYGAPREDERSLASLVEGGIDFLADFIPRKKRTWDDSDFYYYGNFYAVQAMMASGGERWLAYWTAVRDELLRRQSPGGAWEDEKRWGYSDEFDDTAFALLVLQAPYRRLSLYVD
ncbi:MAG TPA: prenyltransferase/squalene oxidase repeat-containing protein [Planctomycetota bacterium]|nr:prenyltransferase/squalene oxidase repeat-containing protein [Planctomycetota bacterium]